MASTIATYSAGPEEPAGRRPSLPRLSEATCRAEDAALVETSLVRRFGVEARGNPVRIRDCPAAVSGDDGFHKALERSGKRKPEVGVTPGTTSPKTCQRSAHTSGGGDDLVDWVKAVNGSQALLIVCWYAMSREASDESGDAREDSGCGPQYSRCS